MQISDVNKTRDGKISRVESKERSTHAHGKIKARQTKILNRSCSPA